MKLTPDQLTGMHACQICDLLFELPRLSYHQAAHCPRCDHHITTERPRHIEQALAPCVFWASPASVFDSLSVSWVCNLGSGREHDVAR